MMHCYKATEIIEKSKFQKLSTSEMINLRIHLTLCYKCKKYQKLSAKLDDLIRHNFSMENIKYLTPISLTTEEKNKLIAKLSGK